MLAQTLCDRLAQLIVDTRKHSCLVLVEAVLSKLSESLAVVTHRPAVVKVKTLVEKTGHHGCMALVDALAGRQAEMKMQTLGETLVEEEANAPVDTLFETC